MNYFVKFYFELYLAVLPGKFFDLYEEVFLIILIRPAEFLCAREPAGAFVKS